MVFGWQGNPHFGPFHILSNVLTVAGFVLIAKAWNVFYHAQRSHRLATTGLYARMRHPQYVGFVVIVFGFLLQWPTLLTVVMFPILLVTYTLLARSEERDALAEFGDEYRRYMERTPRFIPHIGAGSAATHPPT